MFIVTTSGCISQVKWLCKNKGYLYIIVTSWDGQQFSVWDFPAHSRQLNIFSVSCLHETVQSLQRMRFPCLHETANKLIFTYYYLPYQRLPGACNRSPGSKLLSITTQLHFGGHLGGRARLPDTILEEDHPMTIPLKFGSNWATGSKQDGFYVNFP